MYISHFVYFLFFIFPTLYTSNSVYFFHSVHFPFCIFLTLYTSHSVYFSFYTYWQNLPVSIIHMWWNIYYFTQCWIRGFTWLYFFIWKEFCLPRTVCTPQLEFESRTGLQPVCIAICEPASDCDSGGSTQLRCRKFVIYKKKCSACI